ncbi:nucleoporin [Tieghemostelium lacteum]|uniref:Nuclear pore complex protein n=1 Tax=Tieghemostelium lacteum TaxID=361077 RepID=A0A151ZC48_TIELA|nr:nucleoporin [Tieghemostelium lacteum]|eukprot:KYQ91518.1 nucleoporin [Tieghemostelium lacteum]
MSKGYTWDNTNDESDLMDSMDQDDFDNNNNSSNNNSYSSTVFGRKSVSENTSNKGSFSFGSSEVSSNKNTYFDIDNEMFPSDNHNNSDYNDDSQNNDSFNSTTSGSFIDNEGEFREEIFRNEIFNQSDDDAYYQIIGGFYVEISKQQQQQQQKTFLNISKRMRALSKTKLSILKGSLDRSFFLPNKNQLEKQMESFKLEYDTWDLVSKLYEYRDIDIKEKQKMSIDNQSQSVDQTTVLKQLLDQNQILHEIKILLDWLQAMSIEVGIDSGLQLMEYTRKALEQKQQNNGSDKRKLVWELDADAMGRLNAELDEHDERSENHFLQAVWSLVRAGDIEGASALCVDMGQSWRAQTFIGFQPSNYQQSLNFQGNPFNNLWRSNCQHLSERARNIYERAIYGSLCGNLEPLLNVSVTWYDYLWSHLKTIYHYRIYQELYPYRSEIAQEEDGPYDLREPQPNTALEVLNSLKTNSNTEIKSQSKKPYHIIQELIINDQYDLLMETLLKFQSTSSENVDLLRFSVHLIIFYRTRTSVNSRSIGSPEDLLVCQYIRHLIESNQNQLVAFYTSLLVNADLRIKVYSEFLVKIHDERQRVLLLELADQFGLNTQDIARSIVALSHKTSNASGTTTATNVQDPHYVSEDDQNKIRSIVWLTHEKNLLIEAIVHSNQLVRDFLQQDKMAAVEMAVSQLSNDFIPKALDGSQHEQTSDIIREYNDYKIYLEAHERIYQYLQHFSKKPTPLDLKPPQQQSPHQPVPYSHHLVYERAIKSYEAEFQNWDRINQDLGEKAVHATKSIIKSQWLEFPKEPKIEQIKKKLVPQLFNQLFFVYTNINQLHKSISIANHLVDNKFRWFSYFTQSQIQEFLLKIKDNYILQLKYQH